MSSVDNSMDMNSLMEAIYGSRQKTEYIYQHDDHDNERLPQFMQSLINHLIELCVTQGFADNVQRTLQPWVRDVKIHYKDPKNYLAGFMKDFLRLLRQEVQKINRYGEKKLKYLTQTVSRQIFTEIMRMSCQLKLQSVNRTNHLRTAQRKTNNIVILVHSLNKILFKDISQSFKQMKKTYLQGIQNEENFIQKLESSLDRLNHLYKRAKMNKLWKAMSLWRIQNIQLSQAESISIFSEAKEFFHLVLPDIVNTWQIKPINWVNVITQNLANFVTEKGNGGQGTQIEFIANPQMQNNSLDYSALSSQRSLSQLSSISIQTYLQNQEIKYDTENRFLVIPIPSDQQNIGLIKISWQDQLPIILFHRTARLVELLREIIQGFAKITTRLCYYNAQYENGSWQQDLYQLCHRDDVIDLKEIQRVLTMANVSSLEIFHDRKVAVSCIKYGKDSSVSIPQNVYKLIWDKLETVQSFKLDREDKRFEILKIGNGFCRYCFEDFYQAQGYSLEDKRMTIECIVPILTKNLGKIGCPLCNIKIKETKPVCDLAYGFREENKLLNNSIADLPGFNWKLFGDVKDAQDVASVQKSLSSLLSRSFQNSPVFAKFFYTMDEVKRQYIYRSEENNKIEIKKIEMPKALGNENIFTIESNESLRNFKDIVSLMHQSPMFKEAEIYQYQHQKKKPFKIFPKKLGRKGLFLLATYEDIPETLIQSVLEACGSQIEKNQKLFVKQDIKQWISKTSQLHDNQDLKLNEPTNEQLRQASAPEILHKICLSIDKASNCGIWKVSSDKVIQIGAEGLSVKGFPIQFLKKEPIRSHQNVRGVHRVLHLSKNYGQKLKECLTYIPNFGSTKQKLKYLQLVSESTQQAGESADHCYKQVSQFLFSAGKCNKKQFQFISVPVRFLNKLYIVVLVYDTVSQISDLKFKAISKYIQRIVEYVMERKYYQMKQNSLLWLQNNQSGENPFIFNKKKQIKFVVGKFWQNYELFQFKKGKLEEAISNSKYAQNFRQIKNGFERIKIMSNGVRNVYLQGCEYLINKIVKIYGLKPFRQSMIRLRNRQRGIRLLQKSFQKIFRASALPQRVTLRVFFDTISQQYVTKRKSKQLRTILSIKTINSIFSNIYRRNLLEYFSKGYQNLVSLQRSLIILQQQFALISPKTVKVCIEFLIGRLNLMLSQHYQIPISISIINCGYGYRKTESPLLEKDTYIFVRDSSFAFQLHVQQQLNGQQLGRMVEMVLSKILPNWQVTHRKHQSSRIRILYQFLQTLRLKHLRHLFSLAQAQRRHLSIQQHKTMQTKAIDQVARMQEQQSRCNPAINIQKRQKHRREIDEIKQDTRTIQNQLDRISVEARIKSKTNAAYRMLHLLNNTCKENMPHNYNSSEVLKEVAASRKDDAYRHLCQTVPLWTASISRIIKKNYNRNAEHFLNLIASMHI